MRRWAFAVLALAMRSHYCHAIEQISFFIAGIFFWMPAIGNARRGSRGRFRNGFGVRTLDAGNFIHRHFHAQRPDFDFRGRTVQTSKNHRLAESPDANLRAGLQAVGAYRFQGGGMRAKVRLRFRDRLDHCRVKFFARRAANVLHLSPRAFFKLRAKFAFLHPFNHACDVFIEALLHFAKLLFQSPDTPPLALDPLRAQFHALFFERMALEGEKAGVVGGREAVALLSENLPNVAWGIAASLDAGSPAAIPAGRPIHPCPPRQAR